jgi:hypothetical protein
MPYRIYFQSVNYDFNGQVADYVSWSHYVALERAEMRPLEALPKALKNHIQHSG